MPVHVRYNSLYISVPSSAKQQREMTDFCVAWRTLTTTATFYIFISNLSAVFRILFCDGFDSDRQNEWL